MSYFKSYSNYDKDVNEASVFDKMFSWMSKISNMFKNPDAIQKSVEATITQAGQSSATTFNPKSVAIKETYFIMMGDGKDSKTNFSMSITKIADLTDGSGLFTITGTTNPEMLKALTGSNVIEDLTKNSIMAIISNKSFLKGKVMTLKILKNILPGGKDYVSEFVVTGIAPGTSVEKTYNNSKV